MPFAIRFWSEAVDRMGSGVLSQLRKNPQFSYLCDAETYPTDVLGMEGIKRHQCLAQSNQGLVAPVTRPIQAPQIRDVPGVQWSVTHAQTLVTLDSFPFLTKSCHYNLNGPQTHPFPCMCGGTSPASATCSMSVGWCPSP